MPTRLKTCLTSLTPIPVKDMSGDELVRLLAKVRQSELAKTRCGRDVIQWYDAVRGGYGSTPAAAPKKKWFGFFQRKAA